MTKRYGMPWKQVKLASGPLKQLVWATGRLRIPHLKIEMWGTPISDVGHPSDHLHFASDLVGYVYLCIYWVY